MNLSGLVPVPSDALVTPVSFKVKSRKLRGLLTDLDAKEDGSRELSGEWVVGRKTWQRMQKEWKASKSGPQTSNNSEDILKSQKRKELVVLYIHGGWSNSHLIIHHDEFFLFRRILFVKCCCHARHFHPSRQVH